MRLVLLFCATLLLISLSKSIADDVGITKARIIQISDSSYLIEADISQSLLWTIKAPIFPDRFQVSGLEYINQSGWIIARAIATTSGNPLQWKDEILLPWSRNGVDLVVQWLDGSLHKAIFMRTIDGIHIPLEALMPRTISNYEVVKDNFVLGLKHIPFKLAHIILVLALIAIFPAVKTIRLISWFALGQACSMIMVELGLPGFDLLFVDMLGLLLVFLLSLSKKKDGHSRSFGLLCFGFALIHGLSFAHEIQSIDLGWLQRIKALFAFNLGIDAGQFILALTGLAFVRFLKLSGSRQRLIPYLTGSLAITGILILLTGHSKNLSNDILGMGNKSNTTPYSLPISQNQTSSSAQRGASKLTTPIMNYITIEPFEIRQEILVNARMAIKLLGINDSGMGSIPIQSLDAVKNGILSTLEGALSLSVDGSIIEPVLTRVDFVTLGIGGVLVRQEPQVESLDKGIIGVTLVYETRDLANDLYQQWTILPEYVEAVESTIVDPFGGSIKTISKMDNQLEWKRRLSGYRVPVVEAVVLEKPKLPLVSIAMFLLSAVLLGIAGKVNINRRLIVLSGVLGLVFYPFLRFPTVLPFIEQWKPSVERTSEIIDQLLTNVYRSFDVRNENDVYDRLATSVTGDQLVNIYLENRQSLELENRGGARANMDDLDILNIFGIQKAADGGFVADVQWTVGGSVSHFGHTHYRQNQYRALVTFNVVEEYWMIRNIETIDERRIL